MKKVILFLGFLCCVLVGQAQKSNEVDITLKVYDPVDFPPHFPNGLNQGLDKFLAQHFRYPEEAWQAEKVKEAEVSFIIRKDGSLCSVETPEGLHPALAEALKTTLPKMPLWFPGYKNTQKVDARVGCVIPLVNRRTGVPYHLRPLIEKTRRYTDMAEAKPLSPVMMADAVKELDEVFAFYPEHKETPVALTRMLVSQGKAEDAVMRIDRSAREYSRLNLWRDAEAAKALVYRPGYNGRNEIALHLQLAMTLDMADRQDRAHRQYERVIALIDEKLRTHDIGSPSLKESDEEEMFWQNENLIEQLQFRLKYAEGTRLTDEDWARLTTVQQTSANLIPIVEQFVAEGKVGTSSRTARILNQLKALQVERATGRTTSKDLRSLAGVKVLAVYLCDGLSAALQFTEQAMADKPADKSVYAKLNRQMQAHQSQLADRLKAVRALASYPDSSTDTTRKALCEVFPIEWLEK